MSPNRHIGVSALLLALGVCAQVLYSLHAHAPILTQDSYQYLDAASHFLSEGRLVTSVAHFDEQVHWGRLPIPFTHFGMGYPLAIAALGRLGIPLAVAGLLLSIAGYLLVIWLLWKCCLSLEFGRWTATLVCLLWTLNSYALEAGANVMTEALFTTLLTTLCMLIAGDLHDGAAVPMRFLLMGAITGATYVLRQAGLFLIPPVLLYLGWRSLRDPRVRRWAAASGLIAVGCAATVILRNIILTGSWNGGFSDSRHAPRAAVLAEIAKAPYHILVGSRTKAHFDIWAALLLLSGAALAGMALAALRRRREPALPTSGCEAWVWIALLTAAYAGGVLLAALTTIASSVERFYFPLLPVMLLMVGALVQLAGRSGRIVSVVLVLAVVAINAKNLILLHPAQQHAIAADLLAEQVQPGISVRRAIENLMPANGTLFATNGQAVHYLLHRPVVSVLESSNRAWDESDVRSLMRRFHAGYFLVFPGAQTKFVPEQESTPFLHALAAGQSTGWLSVAARSRGTILYRCAECL